MEWLLFFGFFVQGSCKTRATAIPGRPQGIAPTIDEHDGQRMSSSIVGAIPCGRPGMAVALVLQLLNKKAEKQEPFYMGIAPVEMPHRETIMPS